MRRALVQAPLAAHLLASLRPSFTRGSPSARVDDVRARLRLIGDYALVLVSVVADEPLAVAELADDLERRAAPGRVVDDDPHGPTFRSCGLLAALLPALAATLLSLAQRALSKPARYVRRAAPETTVLIESPSGPVRWQPDRLLATWEWPLTLLSAAAVTLAVGLLVMRL